MSEASFTIRAIDATRQAFGQIQNSLTQLKNSSQTASAFMKRVFDPQALGTGLATAFGISLVGAIDKAVEAAARFASKFDDIRKMAAETATEVQRIYAEAAFEAMTPEGQLADMARRRAEMEKRILELRKQTAVVAQQTMTMDRTGQVRTVVTREIRGTREEADELAKLEREYAQLAVASDKIVSKQSLDRAKQLDDEFQKLVETQRKANDLAEAARIADTERKTALKEMASAQLDLLDPMREYQRQIEAVNMLEREDALNVEQAAARRAQINAEAQRAIGQEIALLQDAAEAQRDILDPARQYQREIALINELLAKKLLEPAEAAQRLAQITAASAAQRSAAEGEVLATMNQLEDARARITGEEINYAQRIAVLREREKAMLAELATLGAAGPAAQIAKQRELIELYTEMESLIEQQTRLARDAGEMIASGFEDAILSGNKLSDVLRNLAQDLIRLVFRNTITAPLASAIGGILTGGIPFLAKGGTATANSPYVVGEKGPELFVPGVTGAVVSNAKIARIMSMMSGGLDFLAKGGQARAGSSYIVGEEGPELFVPGSTGSVIPNSRLRGMEQANTGPTVNISYNIQSGVSRAELQPILEQERKRLRAEIPDMVRRGGSYRSAFA